MKKILEKIEGSKNIALLLDYDGTLVPIKKRPELARIHPSRRKLLDRILKIIPVSIVSGRSLSEMNKFIRLDGVSIIGNHGFEISYNKKVWVHPEAKKIRGILRKTMSRIKERTKNLNGVIVEDKGLSGSVHLRLLKSGQKGVLRKIVEEEVTKGNGKLKIRKGKKVFEIIPNIGWDKGKGVEKFFSLLNLKEDFLKIYIGDDETDEDAFRTLKDKDITILVGRRKNSLAKFRLKNVEEVWLFIKELSKRLKK